MEKVCRNPRCQEDDFAWNVYDSHRLRFCPSCWWMLKTTVNVGLATLTALGFLAAAVEYFAGKLL